MWTSDVRNRFEQSGKLELFEALERGYAELLSRRRPAVFFGDPAVVSEPERALKNCIVARQALLHRAERLHFSCGSMVADENPYGLALLIRAHLEASSILGFLCDRLHAFTEGHITFDRLHENAAAIVVGARHEFFSKAPAPIGIMTAVEKADKHLRRLGFSDDAMISDCYGWLSELAHPNFLSFAMGAMPVSGTDSFAIHHNLKMRDDELSLAGYLDISNMLFIALYDDLEVRWKVLE